MRARLPAKASSPTSSAARTPNGNHGNSPRTFIIVRNVLRGTHCLSVPAPLCVARSEPRRETCHGKEDAQLRRQAKLFAVSSKRRRSFPSATLVKRGDRVVLWRCRAARKARSQREDHDGEATQDRWRSEYGGMKLDQVRRWKELEVENDARLRNRCVGSHAGQADPEGSCQGKLLSPSRRRACIEQGGASCKCPSVVPVRRSGRTARRSESCHVRG
jgi:putative transposase